MKTPNKHKNINKSGLIIFIITFIYNLAIGIYLKDFLVIAPTLTVFYLLSILSTLFLLIDSRSTGCRAVIYIALFFTLLMNLFYAVACQRPLGIMTFILAAMEMLYFALYGGCCRKDKLVTKICTIAVSALIFVSLLTAYNFVFKCENVSLANGRATMWDTETQELADEICRDCETDEEKVQVIYQWIIHNFEYDEDYYPIFQYFDVHKTLHSKQGICYDFANLFSAFCRSQGIPCCVMNGTSYNTGGRHAWNRVYFNSVWWNVDTTNDITQSRKQGELYGMQKVAGYNVADEHFYILKIQ